MRNVKRGEIYYADLSPVVGSEQDGTRPVLVIQNDTGNKFSPTTIVAAITSKSDKAKLPTHVIVRADGLEVDSVVLLEQIRTIDKQRLIRYSGRLDKVAMGRVDHAIIVSFGIKYMESCKTCQVMSIPNQGKNQKREKIKKEQQSKLSYRRKQRQLTKMDMGNIKSYRSICCKYALTVP